MAGSPAGRWELRAGLAPWGGCRWWAALLKEDQAERNRSRQSDAKCSERAQIKLQPRVCGRGETEGGEAFCWEKRFQSPEASLGQRQEPPQPQALVGCVVHLREHLKNLGRFKTRVWPLLLPPLLMKQHLRASLLFFHKGSCPPSLPPYPEAATVSSA